jgi:hypothetical protein
MKCVYIYTIETNKQKTEAMKTTITNQEAKDLINSCFDSQGFLINPKSRKNKAAAQAIIDSGYTGYGELLDGFSVCDSLFIIANPNKSL